MTGLSVVCVARRDAELRGKAPRRIATRRDVVDDQPTSEPEAQGWGVGPGWAPCGLRGKAQHRGVQRGVGRHRLPNPTIMG